jgi:hypothetical protein
MKKLIIACISVVFCTASSHALIAINWNSGTPAYENDGTSFLADTDTLAIFISDDSTSSYDGSDPSFSAAAGGDTFVDVEQLDSQELPLVGYISSGVINYDGTTYNNKYWYAVVFDYTYNSSLTSVPAGTWYRVGTLSSIAIPDGHPTVSIDVTGSAAGWNMNEQVVPEPATAMLGLFGVGVIVYRRWRDRR